VSRTCSRSGARIVRSALPLAVPLLLAFASACDEASPPPLDPACDAPPREPLRGECGSAADCDDSNCVLDATAVAVDRDPAALTCGAAIGAAPAGADCPSAEVCASGLCAVSGVCVAPCLADAHCSGGESCRRVEVRTGPLATGPVFACVAPVVVAEGVSVGRSRVDDAYRADRDTAVRLPSAEGPALHVLVPACGADGAAVSLATRSDPAQDLFRTAALGKSEPQPNPINPFSPTFTVLVPSGGSSIASPDGYVLTLRGDKRADADLFTLSGSPEGTQVAVDVFLLGGGGFELEGDDAPEALLAALAEADTLLAVAGISLGAVRAHSVAGALRELYETVERDPGAGSGTFDPQYPELGELAQLTAGLGRVTVPIFLVKTIDGMRAISINTPGSAGVYGTRGSAIVVGADAVSEGELGTLLAHEIAHYLGLFHTVEFDGTQVESLADTPVCTPASDDDGDGVLESDECAAQGSANLMFWDARGTELTDDQSSILATSFALSSP
jgi:hypothetical protein